LVIKILSTAASISRRALEIFTEIQTIFRARLRGAPLYDLPRS